VHWSALVVAALAILGSFSRPAIAIFGVFCFAGIMILHEVGHTIAAHRVGAYVQSIELYPIHGRVRYEVPWSRIDDCRIAWGGCLAQLVIALPFIGWLQRFGYPANDTAAAVLALLGPFNVGIAAFNLLPIPGLDGSKAWYLLPLSIQAWWKKRRVKRVKKKDVGLVEFRRRR
jgi:Zn-dependent protease